MSSFTLLILLASRKLFGLLPTQNGLSVTLMEQLIEVPQLVEEFLGIAMQICFLVLLKILEAAMPIMLSFQQ